MFLAHLWAGGMLLMLAMAVARSGSWSATANYLVLGLGIMLAPVVVRPPLRPAWLKGEAFSLIIGITAVLNGLVMLVLPGQFRASGYDLVRPYLAWYGPAFTGSGLLLCLSHIGPLLPSRLARWAAVCVAGAFFALCATVAVPSHGWLGVAYYGGFGAVLVALSRMGPRLRRIDPRSLRTRLALVLAAAAAVPVLVLVPLYANEVENQELTDVLARQQALAGALAQDASDYITLHQAAVKLLAGQPGLLALSPAEQHAVLNNNNAAYPDVSSFSTAAADGESIALGRPSRCFVDRRPRVRGSPSDEPGSHGYPHLAHHQQPVFSLGVPILDADGRFGGMVSASLESSRISALLKHTDFGADAQTYLARWGGTGELCTCA